MSLMTNPFWKILVTEISKPNRSGLVAPIRIDPMSMHRHCAIGRQAVSGIRHQPCADPFDVLVSDQRERPVSQLDGKLKDRVVFRYVHNRIVDAPHRNFHCGFPSS